MHFIYWRIAVDLINNDQSNSKKDLIGICFISKFFSLAKIASEIEYQRFLLNLHNY